MLPDLLAEKVPGYWTIYIADVRRGFVPQEPLPRSPLAFPHSGAFISLLEYEEDGREYAAGSVLASVLYCIMNTFVCIIVREQTKCLQF